MAEVTLPLSNGDTVIYDEDRKRGLVFNLDDIYKYRLVDDSSDVVKGKGTYIPNEDDLVYAYELGLLRVARQDLTNYAVDLVIWQMPKSASEVGVADALVGVGPGYPSETWRVMIDSRVFPYRMDIDARLHMYSEEASEVRVFKGINTSVTGEIISAYYNQSGDYVSDAIPLKPVASVPRSDVTSFPGLGNAVNLAIKAPVMGYTSKQLEDGSLVTVVTYNNLGTVISRATMLVWNTNVVRHPDDSDKRVQSIELISPYLSTTEPNTLEVPINVTVATLALRGKVTYTDGSSIIIDVVDEAANGKFKLLGLKYWSPSITGAYQELALSYTLSPSEEYSYLQGETANGCVTVPYRIKGMPVDPTLSLKLFAFPIWIDSVSGYGLEYWLYDLTRQIGRKVPKAAVELSETSPSFDGLNYTSTQYLQFGVNLSVVDAAYGSRRHSQAIQFQLLRDGGIRASNWRVKFSANQPSWFGDNLAALVSAKTGGMSTINLKNGYLNQDEWLANVYAKTSPLYDPQTEVAAPAPTHFIITTKTRSYEAPIGQWANDITFINDLAEGETVYLKWVRRLANGDLQLGVSGLPIHNV